jgi:hypothetical protein
MKPKPRPKKKPAAVVAAALAPGPTDAAILAQWAKFEAAEPEAFDLIDRTAEALGCSESRVMDALEADAMRKAEAEDAAEGFPSGIRSELFGDVASQFEKMEQPLNLAWMFRRLVTVDELRGVSAELGAMIRRRLGEPSGPLPADPTDTTLGQRAAEAAKQKEPAA